MKGDYDMITIEQVEKIRERANVSYEDAKAALEATEGDMLEAMIFLEKQGKILGPRMNSYNTDTGASMDEEDHHERHGRKDYRDGRRRRRHNDDYDYDYEYYDRHERRGPTIRQQMHYFWLKLCALIRKTNANQFEVSKDGRSLLCMPVTLLLVSLICFFWVTLPLLIIALFFGYRYSFIGPDFGKDTINNVMDRAADTAENIKRSMMEKDAQGENDNNNNYNNNNDDDNDVLHF
jgi:hypothetical protein